MLAQCGLLVALQFPSFATAQGFCVEEGGANLCTPRRPTAWVLSGTDPAYGETLAPTTDASAADAFFARIQAKLDALFGPFMCPPPSVRVSDSGWVDVANAPLRDTGAGLVTSSQRRTVRWEWEAYNPVSASSCAFKAPRSLGAVALGPCGVRVR